MILDRLRDDPATRRAIALIADANDNFGHSVEYPCAVSIHFFVRDDRLHVVLHMRAQQALFVLPYDAFLFMSLQVVLARELGLEVGRYHHFCGTFHIYLDERELAERVVADAILPLRLAYPDGPLAEIRNGMAKWESSLRVAAEAKDVSSLWQLAAQVEVLPSSLEGQAARVFLMKAATVSALPELAATAIAQLGSLAPLAAGRPTEAEA